ncbi:MAG TPA: winged helix-turn-helix domain-containing protein [Candidatus Cybelea sp.]|nr:winged helix-turn-helix domain-containing protein [Candidatus Cybelea sp.]
MSVYEFGPFQLDAERLLLSDRGEPVPLGPKVVETLLALIEHPGDVLTKTALLDRIWPEGYVDEANLAQNVYVLRKTLRARWDTETIETIPRRGYRFTAAVERRDAMPLAQPILAMRKRRSSLWRNIVAAASAVAVAAGLAFALLSPHNVAAKSALSPDGARLYEIGRYYWNLRTKDGIEKSLAYFARVIDTDPHSARGYAALASANAIMADYEFGPSTPSVYYARATAYAKKALAMDPNYGEAYAVLGMISNSSYKSKSTTDQMSAAFDYLKRAIALDPGSGPAHEWYGVALLERGKFNDAFSELRVAANLDPLSVATTAWLSEAAYHEHRYDEAIAYAQQTLDLSPTRSEVYETLGLAYEARGDRVRALDAFHRLGDSCTKCRAQAAALMAELYARSNRIAEAREQLAIAQAHSDKVSPDDLAVALAAIGERATALSWLRRTKGEYIRAEIASDPRFALLRTDPRVAQLENPA